MSKCSLGRVQHPPALLKRKCFLCRRAAPFAVIRERLHDVVMLLWGLNQIKPIHCWFLFPRSFQGHTYYINHHLKTSQWTAPTASSAGASPYATSQPTAGGNAGFADLGSLFNNESKV